MSCSLHSLSNEIDSERLSHQITTLAEIGRTVQGGVTRLGFTREDMAGRRLLHAWMEQAGLMVRRDAIGNLIGTLPGRDANAPLLACGSHIDTVVNAGKYDGIVGMLAAVECARVLHQAGGLNAPLEAICFAMEESSRFGASYGFGSRVMAGFPIPKEELFARDRSKVLLARAVQELKSWETGSRNHTERTALHATQEDIDASRYDWSHVRAFIELHIEQGPVLEHARKQIGIVTAVAAPTRLQIILRGEQNHSGTTPMHLRHDALVAAAEIILAVELIAKEFSEQHVVGTVGVIQAEPNVINVIPGYVELRVDVRSTSAEAKGQCVGSIHDVVHQISVRRGITAEIKTLTDEMPVVFSSDLEEAIALACDALRVEPLEMPSGAGHDAAHIARVAPAGMIFIPSHAGISHDPREFSSSEDIMRGTQVLLHALLALDTQV